MTANGTTAAPADPYAAPQTPLPGARAALILLLAINLFNYIDRQVLAAVEPEIRKELLLLTRCFVGVGEGAYGPVAPTMLSDLYPVKERGRVLAWFYVAIPVGGALGYAFGEVVQRALGWRWAFFLVVPPGLLLGLWCFFMREPPRGQSDQAVTPRRKATV